MYRLHRAGGRVKSAGLGLASMYPDEARLYAEEASPEGAARLRSAFRGMQDDPPFPLAATFFPQERSAIKHNLQRTGLYRPFLKTDQGPGGTFLPFVTADVPAMRRSRIAKREGVAIPEVHLREVLAADPEAGGAVERVRDHFKHYRLAECATALEEISKRIGFKRREAGVGRGLFFFCNASAADEPVTVPEHICARVEKAVNELLERVEGTAAHARALYHRGVPLPEAITSAVAGEPVPSVLYLQADVYVMLDGTIEIDQIQLPDVGLFLTELDSQGYAILPQVQQIVGGLRQRTVALFESLPSPTYLLTRPEVIHSLEDTLEHLEVRALRKMAREAGLDLRLGTSCSVAEVPQGGQVILLNVDPRRAEWEPLLERVARGEVRCSPDPFLKLLSGELTTQRRCAVRGVQLERFLRTIRPGGQMGPKSYHAMHRGIERIYGHGRHTSDVLHVEVPGERTPVPTLRHSVHSFMSLYNTCKRNGFPDLNIREVPITRENAVLHSDGGPHICAFRFYFTRA